MSAGVLDFTIQPTPRDGSGPFSTSRGGTSSEQGIWPHQYGFPKTSTLEYIRADLNAPIEADIAALSLHQQAAKRSLARRSTKLARRVQFPGPLREQLTEGNCPRGRERRDRPERVIFSVGVRFRCLSEHRMRSTFSLLVMTAPSDPETGYVQAAVAN